MMMMMIHRVEFQLLSRILAIKHRWHCVTVSEGSLRCNRTLKYFQAVAHKSWVLSVDWARDCIAQRKLLPPV